MKNPAYKFMMCNDVTIFRTSYEGTELNRKINPNDGTTFSNATTNVTGFIPVVPSSVLYIGRQYDLAFYDKNKVFVFGFDSTQGNIRIPQVPSNAYYMRTTVVKQYWNMDYEIFQAHETFPIYKDDLSIDYELETNQRFYRPKLSGKISFVRNEYNWIMSQDFETVYRLFLYQIDQQTISGLGKRIFRAKMMRTDMTINKDNQSITVQPNNEDDYSLVLAGLEKEYNLIELAPEITDLIISKRPLIQVYIPGDNIVSCFLSGSYWEQDANATNNIGELTGKYYFWEAAKLQDVNVVINGTPTNAAGLYAGKITNTDIGLTAQLTRTDGLYSITYTRTTFPLPLGGNFHTYRIKNSGGTVIFEQSLRNEDDFISSLTLNPLNGATGNAVLSINTTRIFARYLLDVDHFAGKTTYYIPADDIVDNNRNYRRVIGFDSPDLFHFSTRYSVEPTKWGRANNGLYFLPPYSVYGDAFFPVARSKWYSISLWFAFSSFDFLLEQEGRAPYKLRDAYTLSSCIRILLNQFCGIKHEATEEYSEFLYGTRRPIGGVSVQQTVLITQKSNILSGNYQQPSQKAPTTLQQFTNMLRDCYRCFWYIEDGKFKIEHIEWFKNGGSYLYQQQIQYDTTSMINTRNGKRWSFSTSEVTFDKQDLPERYQFEWMDEVTAPFKGEPIEILSKYVTEGKIEEINISNFTSDVDMMLLNPGNMSKDGFALFSAIRKNLFPQIYDTSGDTIEKGNGFINEDGSRVYDPNGRGKGWVYMIVRCLPQTRYILMNSKRQQLNGVYWCFYTSGLQTIYRDTNVSGDIFTTPTNCAALGLCVRVQADANPAIQPIIPYNEMAYIEEQTLSLPFVRTTVNGVDYTLQNGFLAFIHLQPSYWVYDLPAYRIKMNGLETRAADIERKRKQVINFPAESSIPDPMKLVKTELGNGQVDKISLNLCSRGIKATLKYTTNG